MNVYVSPPTRAGEVACKAGEGSKNPVATGNTGRLRGLALRESAVRRASDHGRWASYSLR